MKYTAIVLIVIAVVAAVLYERRNAIVRRIANSVLEEQGITTEDLEIERLGRDRIELSSIVLRQDDGTRYRIEGLSFPLTFPSDADERISIERLDVLLAEDGETDRRSFAELLDTILSLPQAFPQTVVSVSSLHVASYPPIGDVVWRSDGQDQSLGFSTVSGDLAFRVTRSDESTHGLSVSGVAMREAALSLDLTIERSGDGYTISGPGGVSLSPWLSLLKSADLISPGTRSIEGRLDGEISVTLPAAGDEPATFQTSMTPIGELYTEYERGTEFGMTIRTLTATPLEFRLRYPATEWSLTQRSSSVVVGMGPGTSLPVRFESFECHQGISCSVIAAVDIGPVDVPGLAIGKIAASMPLTIEIGDEASEIALSPESTASFTGIRADNWEVDSVSVSRFSGATLSVSDAPWRLEDDAIDLTVNELRAFDIVLTRLPLSISNLRIDKSGAAAGADFVVAPGAGQLVWQGLLFPAPGIAGTAALEDGTVTATTAVSSDAGIPLANVTASYDLATGAGRSTIGDAGFSMSRRKLSGHWLNWPYDWDVVSGELTLDAELEWTQAGDTTALTGAAALAAVDLSGNYGDIVFAGVNTVQDIAFEPDSKVTAAASDLTVGLVDIGVPVEALNVDYTFEPQDLTVRVDDARWTLFGGDLAADPFVYDIGSGSAELLVSVGEVQLPLIRDLIGFEAVSMSGSLSGTLPLTVSGNVIMMTGGRLESDAPGGVIRYLGPGSSGAGEGETELGIVTGALNNFEYDSLTADVDYGPNGDLVLQMRLTGINPQMDPNQPIILNLGLENNVPQMLRSLQVTRAAEDILRRRAQQ